MFVKILNFSINFVRLYFTMNSVKLKAVGPSRLVEPSTSRSCAFLFVWTYDLFFSILSRSCFGLLPHLHLSVCNPCVNDSNQFLFLLFPFFILNYCSFSLIFSALPKNRSIKYEQILRQIMEIRTEFEQCIMQDLTCRNGFNVMINNFSDLETNCSKAWSSTDLMFQFFGRTDENINWSY